MSLRPRQFHLRLICLALVGAPNTVLSEPLAPVVSVCSGWLPSVEAHGLVGAESPLKVNECPSGQVMMSERIPASYGGAPRHLAVTGACCAYPNDALTDQRVRASVQCPPNHVVTGAYLPQRGSVLSADLVCTRINTERYELAAPRPAVHITERGGEAGPWNRVLNLFDRGFKGSSFLWTGVPLALRYGLARMSTERWHYEFCTGFPWGSALTGKTLGRGCSFQHKALLRRASTDPTDKPVKVYPDCLAIGSLQSREPECIR